jgi:hypothetical protein
VPDSNPTEVLEFLLLLPCVDLVHHLLAGMDGKE